MWNDEALPYEFVNSTDTADKTEPAFVFLQGTDGEPGEKGEDGEAGQPVSTCQIIMDNDLCYHKRHFLNVYNMFTRMFVALCLSSPQSKPYSYISCAIDFFSQEKVSGLQLLR